MTAIRRWTAALVALLAVASSAVGVANLYTYDDRYIIEMNPFVRNMYHWWRVFATSYWPKDWGGDGYRPLTILAFKFESTIGSGSPLPFHVVNIVLYALSAVLVFALAKRLLPAWAAWITAALFAVHPVHVEAVANIVGQSELLVGVSVLGATLLYIDARRAGALTLRSATPIALLYVVGCFAKEHGIVLPAILGAAELTVLDGLQPIREKVRRLGPFYAVLTVLAIGFVAVRAIVLSDHPVGGFAPFTPFSSLHITWFNRALTALGVVPEWLRLFYWPAHLSAEYGPPDIEIAQGLGISQLPGLMILVATLAFALILRRRRPVISFGIAFVCVTLLPSSNFILPAGIVLAERTLFLPSVGAMLVLGDCIVALREHVVAHHAEIVAALVERWGVAATALLLVIGVWRSATRTMVWRNNETLFNQTVLDSPNAYRAHYMLGAWSFENNRMRVGEAEYKKALSLFPYDPSLSYNLAERYREVGLCRPAVPLYRWTRGLDPNFPLGRVAFAQCLLADSDYVEAKQAALDGIRAGAPRAILRAIAASADSALGTADSASARPISLAGAPGKVP